MRVVTLHLSAGRLRLGPLLAATLRDNKDRLAAANAGQLQDPFELIDLVVTVAHAGAQRVDATVTREFIEGVVDLENMHQVYAAVWGATLPVEIHSGEAPPGGSPA